MLPLSLEQDGSLELRRVFASLVGILYNLPDLVLVARNENVGVCSDGTLLSRSENASDCLLGNVVAGDLVVDRHQVWSSGSRQTELAGFPRYDKVEGSLAVKGEGEEHKEGILHQ